jgi:4-alpha-glucanotransferase
MPDLSPQEYLLNTASRDKWQRIATRKRAGVLAPLFSIHSKKSSGIGDFSDLKLLIEWAQICGNSIVQLLPMNEVGSLFCPYDSLSSFALEPLYISWEAMPQAKSKSIENKIMDLKKNFPSGRSFVNYALKHDKIKLLRQIFLEWDHSDSLELKKFKRENAYWLLDFALYKVLKDYHKASAWWDWEPKFRNKQKSAMENFQIEHTDKIEFQIWVQWQLYKQFKEVKEFAQSKRVLLKGDLPLLVSRDSADVWAHPEFFKLDFAVGAPPDVYCAKGQRWGMPTYDWDNIEADGFRYLKEKLKFAQNFYDILRIDHVVGLFRIWSIPYDEPLENRGLNGSFEPKDEKKWAEHGRKILTAMLNNTDMLLCAEDLGVIPKVCTDTLKEFGIPGNDVQRWVKDWKTKHDFLKPKEYRALSVAMLSTHDTTNWPAWWENEAGTIDEELFRRRCAQRRIDYDEVINKLFDTSRSCHGRLRWLDSITSSDILVKILGKKKEEVGDFIDFYENSFKEQEKLWKHLGLKGPVRKTSDEEIVRRVLQITLNSTAVFCINTLIDYLYLTHIFKGDPYQYRINSPGTISAKNWSLTIPIPLEQLLKHKVSKEIRNMVASSGRI